MNVVVALGRGAYVFLIVGTLSACAGGVGTASSLGDGGTGGATSATAGGATAATGGTSATGGGATATIGGSGTTSATATGGTGGTTSATVGGTTASTATATGSSTGGSQTTTGGSPTCNAAINDAPWVTEVIDPGTAPLPQGGTFVSGHYVENAATVYSAGGTCTASTLRVSAVIDITPTSASAGAVQEVFSIEGLIDGRIDGTYTLSGTMWTATVSCLAVMGGGQLQAGTSNLDYTATASEIRTFRTSGTCTTVTVLTRLR